MASWSPSLARVSQRAETPSRSIKGARLSSWSRVSFSESSRLSEPAFSERIGSRWVDPSARQVELRNTRRLGTTITGLAAPSDCRIVDP